MLDAKILTFLQVAQTGSYTRAAERLHLTQPAVTQHIQKLEAHYGCKLIESGGRCAQLTRQGELVARYARAQMNNEQRLSQQLRAVRQPLNIGATLSIADYYLPELLSGYAPELGAIRLSVASTPKLLSDVADGRLDCAFLEGNFDRSMFYAYVFAHARFLPVAAANHPLAQGVHTLAQACAYPLVLREEGSGTRAILETLLAQHSAGLNDFLNVTQINSFLLIKSLVAGSDAVSFMYEAVAAREVTEGKLCHLMLSDVNVTHPMYFVYPKDSLNEEECLAFFSNLCPDARPAY